MDTEHVIKQTETWIKSFIIKYNICPFAKNAIDGKRILYAVVNSNMTDQCLEAVFTECQRLDTDAEIETTLIIYPNHFNQFDAYLDFLDMAESLLIKQNYEAVYQLASFHPQYHFESTPSLDPANYTNRSPYPMLHLIREASLEQALQTFSNPDLIPERNIKLTREMGLKKVQAILNAATNIAKE